MKNDGDMSCIEYVQHHMTYQQVGKGFWCFHIDSLLISLLAGSICLSLLFWVSRRAKVHSPGRLQCAVEWLIELIEAASDGFFSKKNNWLGPIGLLLISWIGFMNALDFIPVDIFPVLAGWLGWQFCRPVPTTDINITAGTSLGVFITAVFLALTQKGLVKTFADLSATPFPFRLLRPINFCFEWFSLQAKLASLSCRLFANMLVGELVFIVFSAICPWYLQWLPFNFWACFHLLIVPLQTYIYTLLSFFMIATICESAH